MRRRTPDLTAVKFVQDFLAARLAQPRLCIDATCGNGGDTAFLCGITAPEGKVIGFDVQEAAIASTRKHLEQLGVPAARYELHCQSHADLLQIVQPGTADAVMFNFGWLPGADHAVFSTAQSSIPALQAALEAVRPGGVVSAILYSGRSSARMKSRRCWNISGHFRSKVLPFWCVILPTGPKPPSALHHPEK